MNLRTNEGYVITNQITIGDTEIVLGVHQTAPNQFVTWECKDKTDYDWGHYHNDMLSAQKDFLKRGLVEVQCVEKEKHKPPKKHDMER